MHLADCYHKALPQLRKIAEITETESGIVKEYLPPEPDFTIYLDIDNDAFLCRAEVAYGMEIFSLSDVLKTAGDASYHSLPGTNGKKANRTKTYQPYRDRQREEEIVSRLAGYFPDYDESQEGGKADLRKKDFLKADLLITSYDLLKRDIAEYDEVTFRFEIIDEAQYIKTHTTAAAKSVKLIRSVTKFALTGTPIEKLLSELWSIFDYLMPRFLFAYDSFRTQMEVPIVKNEDEEVLERLHKMIAPFILRRIKRDVLRDLLDKLEEIRYAGTENPPKQSCAWSCFAV